MKILLVDDHFVVREGLAALLRGLLPDVEVSEAGDGEEALQAVQRGSKTKGSLMGTGLLREAVGFRR